MTTLTSFSSLEISELEVKGLILSLFQVILVADGSNYLSHFFGTISHFTWITFTFQARAEVWR